MIVLFSTSVLAAQLLVPGKTVNGVLYKGYYAPTVKKLTVDGVTYYPNEIYLPNEANPAQYRIHSNYSKNTDACAACHATHTAVGGSLLQWGSVYDTCMACHDGTISTTYDVERGVIGTTNRAAYGGMFGTGSEGSLSRHNVVGSVQIFAAPGGNSTGSYEDATAVGHEAAATKMWDVEFGCQSCHSPHGQGGNARILSPDPNKIARVNYVNGAVYADSGDTGYTLGFTNQKLYMTGTAVDGAVYYVTYQGKIASGYEITWIKGYPYSGKTQVWVNDNDISKTTYYQIDNSQGYTVLKVSYPEAITTLKVYFFPGVRVKMNISDYLGNEESVTHVAGLNFFCGACHTDYNTNLDYNTGEERTNGSAEELTGKYTEAYRHQVGFDATIFTYIDAVKAIGLKFEVNDGKNIMTCLTCHYAHGTSETLWNNSLPAEYRGTELAGSSALKRAPNMGTCEACHQKGAGNEGYLANTTHTGGLTPTDYLLALGSYVEEENCADCHPSYSGIVEDAEGNVTSMWSHPAVPGTDGYSYLCQGCHGPASNHIKSPSSFNIINPGTWGYAQQVESCAGTDCHGDGSSALKTGSNSIGSYQYYEYTGVLEEVSEYKLSLHYNSASYSCSTCHNVHRVVNGDGEPNEGLLRMDSANQLCASCHDVGAGFDWSNYMPDKNSSDPNMPLYVHTFKFTDTAGNVIDTLGSR
jgi:predicted CXXCH cytochrome family protein